MRRFRSAAAFFSVLLACACGGGTPGGSSPSPSPIPSPSPTPAPTVPSPLTIRDAVTISVDSSGNWPEDGMSVAASYGIAADWGSYSSAQPFTGATTALAAKVAEVHGRGKLYIQYLVAGIIYTGSGTVGDLRPDLLDCIAIDIDGRRIATPFGSLTMNRANMNEERWREFLRSEMTAAIDSGVDGFVIDDIQAQTLHIGFDSAGVFNEPDMRDFREFLKAVFTTDELASRYGVSDIETFDWHGVLPGAAARVLRAPRDRSHAGVGRRAGWSRLLTPKIASVGDRGGWRRTGARRRARPSAVVSMLGLSTGGLSGDRTRREIKDPSDHRV